MPTSFHQHISQMLEWVWRVQPKSVLDIGVGFGKWGFLCREFTDIWHGNYDPKSWQVRIDGVEACTEYVNPVHAYVYNTVHYRDVRNIVPELNQYDLVIMGDVIEHFPKEEGMDLLVQLRKKARYILIASPNFFFEQEHANNPYQTHHSFWSVDDFRNFQFDYDEFERVFVALIQGELVAPDQIQLNGWAARLVYSQGWLRKRPKIAALVKSGLRRLSALRP